MRGVRRSPGITYDITRSWLAVLRSLATATNARLLLGVNLEDNSTNVARAEVHAFKSGIGTQRIAGYELGNEPELYTGIAWYAVHDGKDIPWYLRKEGTPVFSRPKGYNVHDFTSDFSRFRRALPHQPLAGPATGNLSWLTDLPQFLAAEPGLRWVTFHRYGLNQCIHDPSSPHYPTVPNLLTTLASRGFLQGVGKYVAIAHSHHAEFLIDEMNSVTCNGHPGVSNAFASALWAVDALFQTARAGVDGIQIHSFQGNSNGMFDFKRVHGKWEGEVHPIYYGLLFFAQAAPPGSHLLQISAPHSGDLRTWATLGKDGTVRVVLINDSRQGRELGEAPRADQRRFGDLDPASSEERVRDGRRHARRPRVRRGDDERDLPHVNGHGAKVERGRLLGDRAVRKCGDDHFLARPPGMIGDI